MTSIPSAGDPTLVETMLDAARNYEPMADDELAAAEDRARDRDSPVPSP